VRVLFKFLALGSVLFALACLVIAAPSYYQSYRILKTWPAATGTVVRSVVVPKEDERGGWLYAAQLAFTYEAEGREYVGEYEFPHYSTHADRKQKQLARFPTGSVHQIRYNPENPADIRIQVGYNIHFFVIPIFITGVGLIFAVVAAVFFGLSRGFGRAAAEASTPDIV